ncbi:5'-methylthioadenosine/adenosylhomocysteine nucleosidase [Gracilinema caldarium]|uniref:5'-methylthioadenosine/S-adenosylhomocysteine nucleosidase n=1 Tax=Gracilinema caldarium (strain ATCC 51460 / DSM 7334 / H1) TaxID=744872 RepID=F8EYR1_GRAC1|nr:5'-methylthioadenosine/adenosylhomocysteine nucleosidase [Gracilinema caldarium]AEJ18638.1 5'-methylthioadenosine/S-adenosylhomocysteine nucleosidase [Gracilinema caldarium DSM 7334]
MIGIIGAMEAEVEILSSALNIIQKKTIGPFTYYQGILANKDVVLLQCGIGKVQAAIGCALMLQSFQPTALINTGSAGGIAPNLHFGDVVISEGLMYHDVDVTAFGYLPGQIPGQPQIFTTDKTLQMLAEKAIVSLKQTRKLPSSLNYEKGIISSGDIFMHEQQKIEQMRKTFPHVKAVEMEGAAIAHCCTLFHVPFLVLRSLSDIAGQESPMKFDEFLPLAARNSSEIVMELVQNL